MSFLLTAEVSGVKLPQLNGFLNKDLHRVKNAYVTPKKFTPDLQIFYTFPVFGLNVHVLGVKVPSNAMKRIIFIKLYPTSKRRMLLSEYLPQTSRFFTRIYPQYPWHYATLGNLFVLSWSYEHRFSSANKYLWPIYLNELGTIGFAQIFVVFLAPHVIFHKYLPHILHCHLDCDRHKYPMNNNKDHLVGQLTSNAMDYGSLSFAI